MRERSKEEEKRKETATALNHNYVVRTFELGREHLLRRIGRNCCKNE